MGDVEFRAQRGSVWRLLTGHVSSTVAALALTTVLGKQVYDLTDSEFALGILGLVEFLPSLVLVLLTGTLADRVDRRRLAAAGLVFEAAAVAALALYTSTDPTSATPIFLMVLWFGVARAFAMPAVRSMPADLVPPGRLPWLTVRFAGAWQASAIAGPVIGGTLFAFDPVLPFVVASGLILVGAFAIATVRYAPHVVARPRTTPGVPRSAPSASAPAASAPGSRLHEALEGYRFIRRERVLLGAITLDLMAVLFGGAVALLPAIADDRLGVGAVGLGGLRAAAGIGAALMTITLGFRPLRSRIGVTLLIAVAVFGVGTVLLGLTTSYVLAFFALALLSAADAISVFIRATIVPLLTPDEMRGRVLAFEMVLIGASNELGAFESGVTGQLLGPAPAIVLGGVASIVVAMVWWVRFPALRRMDRFPSGLSPPSRPA
jgi:MFS family permease